MYSIEGQTDRHNMTLFLEWDTARDQPVGFEKPSLNFFDPAEDEQGNHFNFTNVNEDEDDNEEEDDTKETKMNGDKNNGKDNSSKIANEDKTNNDENNDDDDTEIASPISHNGNGNNKEESRGRIRARTTRVRHSPKRNNQQCIRIGCTNKPRFDSAFCCDGCGISTMEKDLLCSLQYAAEMHPYQLRP